MTEGQAFAEHAALIEKAQGIRLADVFAIGPAMIYAGKCAKNKNVAALLTLAGIGTILYNGANYARIEQLKKVNSNDQ
jgi:hypothetical protein